MNFYLNKSVNFKILNPESLSIFWERRILCNPSRYSDSSAAEAAQTIGIHKATAQRAIARTCVLSCERHSAWIDLLKARMRQNAREPAPLCVVSSITLRNSYQSNGGFRCETLRPKKRATKPKTTSCGLSGCGGGI